MCKCQRTSIETVWSPFCMSLLQITKMRNYGMHLKNGTYKWIESEYSATGEQSEGIQFEDWVMKGCKEYKYFARHLTKEGEWNKERDRKRQSREITRLMK